MDFDTAVLLGDQQIGDLSRRQVINDMAPELLDGTYADERADLYSLGATMYEMIAGRPLFAGSREEVLAERQAGRLPSLQREDLPEGLRHLVFYLLAPERDNWPQQADEVAGSLEQLRVTNAQLDRLLKNNVDRQVLKTLASFLDADGNTMIRSSPNGDRIGSSFHAKG